MKVGLILYSVRESMAKNPLATVEEVGKIGYKNIEVCNHNAIKDSGCGFGLEAAVLEETFSKFGSQVVSAHVFPFEKSDTQAVLEYNNILGNKNIVNPMGEFTTYDDLMRQCEGFNKVGKICREAGVNYLYHNHDHEYRSFGGKTIMDIIAENTDPSYVGFELDTFWTMRGGLSPVEMIKHFGKRIKLVHQKDFAWDSVAPINTIGITAEAREMKDGEYVGLSANSTYATSGGKRSEEEARQIYWENRRTAFAEIGTGIMDIQSIIDAANEYSDAEYIILEQDYTRLESEFESIKLSMSSFKKYSGISWDN